MSLHAKRHLRIGIDVGGTFTDFITIDADGSFAKRHQVTTLPGLVVYQDGAVVYKAALPDDPDELLRELLR